MASSRQDNLRLNEAELEARAQALRSTPRFVTLGTHNSCNAKCVFCLEGKYSRFSLQLYKDFFEAKMGRYIENAEFVTFTGFGEVLWVPGIEEFLDYVNEKLPEVTKIFTTNGTPLRPSVAERLARGKYVIRVSLHASTAALHRELTLLEEGSFEQILAQVQGLADARDRQGRGSGLHLELVNILNTKNIDDLPEFLKLAWRLRAQTVTASYMTMFVPDHIGLSCFFEQERANRAVAKAGRIAEAMRADLDIKLPPLFSRDGRPAQPQPQLCREPWQQVYVELQGSVLPCCLWGEHVADLAKGEALDEVWNGPFYRELRRGMASGEPHPWCRTCVRFKAFNVNDIRCHLTNRPRQQAAVLREVLARGLDAGRPFSAADLERLER